ncbi:MAG TPA: SusC/RagA family TonB-linked outer membrane protein [Chitinophaga sp.]|uniref:SusC/RagA family TonB-linked outer membrane protein n=1 Tax=Chitinophaga sp. TaxID=1869181 RepID=UPI002DBBA1B6|nr:SusC/RagA family TonB-linked outer membrane protein [Chitinophaga sp.]HEU4555411.1 SusC/RagA family TonB-linked outer membrane protein [Chitinophaga sp.]
MKLTTLLLLVGILQISAKGFSQKITLDKKNVPLSRVFADIQAQSGFSLLYDNNLIKQAKNIDINVKDASLDEVLSACLSGLPLTYEIAGKIIIIRAKPQGTAAAPPPPQTIQGTVKDESGQPLFGAVVYLKEIKRGAQTGADGSFTIANIAPGTYTLTISFLGYEPQEKQITVNNETINIAVVLKQAVNKLKDFVVVTALGVKRSERSVTYATQQVNGSELTKVKTSNLVNTLNGKVAGLNISSSASGVGGSAKVVLRGNKSGLQSNQALYVIDGVPMNNTVTNQPNSSYGGGTSYDGGDPISNLNPDDIESISVLKGASAAALYGSQGANGVILITTKSGKAGRLQVNASSVFTIDQAAVKPEFQNSYGRTDNTSTQSWGGKTANGGHDNLGDFFQTGQNWTNSVSLSAGTDKAQTYFSYANTSAKGIEPGNKLGRNNITFKETGRFFNDKLTVSGDINYVTQTIDNTPTAGFYTNPLTGLYLFPRGTDILPYKNGYERLDPATNRPTQYWDYMEDIQQNPWWIVHRNINSLTRNRVLMNASVRYDVKPWLNIQARGSIDRINDTYDQKLYDGTSHTIAPENGSYTYRNGVNTQQYGDVIANFNFPINKFKVTGLVGAAIRDVKTSGEYFASGQDGLTLPNVFTIQNFKQFNPLNSGVMQEKHSQWQSVFASANISYNDWVYLDLTARNDWASNLSFTPDMSYFYPSVGLNFILSQVLTLPEAVSYAKVRGSFAQVGNSPDAYMSNPARYTFGAGGTVIYNPKAPFTTLKPELTNSIEFGTEWRFFDNRLNVDATYYKTNTKNQTLEIAASQASFYNSFYINAGNIQNKGVEVSIGYDVFRGNKLKWNTALNYSVNDNKVIDLDNRVPYFTLSGQSGTSYASQFAKGGSYGDIYGTTLQRDAQGRVMIGADGKPIMQTGDYVYLGNANTKWQLGWNNNITYGDFSLGFLIDGKFGGKVLSITQAMMDQYGVSAASGAARDAGGVQVNGVDPNGNAVSTVDAQKWYSVVGGRTGVSSEYIYSATVVRLREVALNYAIPVKTNFIKGLKVGLVGRNLAYFSKKAPFDPEVTMSTGNGLAGVDIFMPPATRSFGLSLNASF